MNTSQLLKLGIPKACLPAANESIRAAAMAGGWKKNTGKMLMKQILDEPERFANDPQWSALANAIIEDRDWEPPSPCDYDVWGRDGIDQASLNQMSDACSLPMAVAGALMPDAHVGYGLPIGGVLALENAVCPYAVGVDIACRMKLSVLDLDPSLLDDDGKHFETLKNAIESGTRFGVGADFTKTGSGGDGRRMEHAVMDQDWTVSRITRENKDKAWNQLGTSGSGNHFVEFGRLTLETPQTLADGTTLEAGVYSALLSHSGSRGTGAAVCSTYSDIARAKLNTRYAGFGRLAWLDMDSQEGQEYWAAMNLMGDYAAANHDVIHRNVSRLAGAQILGGVENHHNFAWKETHEITNRDGSVETKEVYVHRKGATPAGEGVLGVIPGSMGTPAYVVRGKGSSRSLHSASHGAGRVMSRTQAKNKFRIQAEAGNLAKRGIRVLSAGSDEVPGVYKDIDAVMAEQQDLVEAIARFDPKIVKMCGDGSRAED